MLWLLLALLALAALSLAIAIPAMIIGKAAALAIGAMLGA